MGRLWVIVIVCLVCLAGGVPSGAADDESYQEMEELYQHDADIYRLRHMKRYAELFREFMDTTGRIPFEGEVAPFVDVLIATDEQQVYVDELSAQQGKDPYGAEDMRRELQQGLGREQRLWFDPQRAPNGRPVWYYYYVEGACFFFTVHLYSPHGVASQVAQHHAILGLSNCADTHRGYWSIPELLANPAFQEACATDPLKPAWMDHLEELHQ